MKGQGPEFEFTTKDARAARDAKGAEATFDVGAKNVVHR